MVLVDSIIYWVLIIILMARLSVVIKLSISVLLRFVSLSAVSWFIDVRIKGRFSVMFISRSKFWYFSTGRF